MTRSVILISTFTFLDDEPFFRCSANFDSEESHEASSNTSFIVQKFVERMYYGKEKGFAAWKEKQDELKHHAWWHKKESTISSYVDVSK